MNIIPATYDDCAKNLFAREQVRKHFISAVTQIPVEDIKRVYLTEPHLRGFFKRMKKGILDILVELEDGTKINIEIQHKHMADWEKRKAWSLESQKEEQKEKFDLSEKQAEEYIIKYRK